MFEVIVTCRPDFREAPFIRCMTMEEARAVAWQLVALNQEHVVRAWVRAIREAPVLPQEDWE